MKADNTPVDKWSWKDRILLAVVPLIGSLALRLLSLTIRKKTLFSECFEKSRDQGRPIIGAFWHQRLLMMPFVPRPGKTGMLISQHRDGEFIARAIKFFGIDSVRGSTTRGGLSALRGMDRYYREGGNLAITPDGPQGPKHVVQMGVIELARLTGSPIFPVTYGASRRWVLNNWDHFIVPLPFCRIIYIWGEPVWVARDSKREEMEEKRLLLQDRLGQITEEADRLSEKEKGSPRNARNAECGMRNAE